MNFEDKEIGAFYWAIPVLDPDRPPSEQGKQPARYVGEGLFQWIGCGGDPWPARWVGERITCEGV